MPLIFCSELSSKIIPSETATFSKNNAAKPPIPTKINVINGSKGEWSPETDHLKEIQVRTNYNICYIFLMVDNLLLLCYNFFLNF